MENLKTLINNFITGQIMPLGVTAIIVGLVCVGGSFMAGKKARDWGKEHIFWLIAGAAIFYTALSIGPEIAASFGF